MTIRLYWTDLSFEKQQELISELKAELMEAAEEEGKAMLERPGHDKDKNWQQAYCDEYAIDWEMQDSENYDWVLALEDYLEGKAEEELQTKIRAVAIEV